MIKKILIANRGEIASRIIRTCKELHLKTVAVHSEADNDAPFVKMADESYLIGKPRVNESYLNIDKIIEVAKQSGADAIHPGYGLLSENAGFAERCISENITFIGPKPSVISLMGSKINARNAMENAGVPVVPGVSEPLADVEAALVTAEKIGYPVMLKASAGGGGIGMQIVNNREELVKAFEGNQKRATDFFGDGAMYMEKVIENPRHIEIQILADEAGHVVYLGERECSIQRRHQKVVEEAPSPFLDEDTRKRMGEAAVNAAKAIDYSNAGTIEFLVDEQKNFYFLEMNTRLQVEHPITEEVTGFDLVKEQIRVAEGENLGYSQHDIRMDGHAIEVRIYAEDPKTFFPSPGKVTSFEIPEGPNIRHELGITGPATVTPFYDPMIAKLVVRGETRAEAIDTLKQALSNYKVEGIKTNIPMLQHVVEHEAFLHGDTTTDFVNRYINQKTIKNKN